MRNALVRCCYLRTKRTAPLLLPVERLYGTQDRGLRTMLFYHTPSPPTSVQVPPTDPPTRPRKSIREWYEDAGVEWCPDSGIDRLWRHPDYPVGPPSLADLRRDSDEAPYAGARPALEPAVCNTRAENSQGVDYVALTCGYDRSPHTFASLLRIPDVEWEELPHGGYLYRHCCKWGDVRIYHDGMMEGMGSYCQISGDACRSLEAAGKISDWQEFAILCTVTYSLKCVRLDVFKDDRQGLLDIDVLERKFDDGECSTHARESDPRGKRVKGMKGKRVSHTLNIGSRKSDSFMRIYDKTLELRPKGRKIDEWCQEHGHHVRVELELKRKRASAAMKRLAQTGFGEGLIPGLIRGFIDFKEGDASGHNGRRLPTWGPWLEFIGSEAKVQLGVDYVQPTLDKAMYFHNKQYAPTLATAFMAFGGDKAAITGAILKIVQDGKKRMKPKHYRLLADAMAA